MRNMAKRVISLLCIISMFLSVMITAQAAGVGITVENQSLQQGSGMETVEVPIKISNNTGILGMTLQVVYDEDLILTDVAEGDALSALSFTKPGDFKMNPINIVWDGESKNDTSIGTIAILTFTVPKDIVKDYWIEITTEGVFDDDLNDVTVTTTNGKICVVGNKPVDPDEPLSGTIISAPEMIVESGVGIETIEVPVTITGNTGILGMTLQVSYDEGLTLTGVKKGEALPSLVFTRPGDFTENPVNIVWDGEEIADATNGIIAILTFNVPKYITKDYQITFSTLGVFDDALNDLNIATRKGKIIVKKSITQTYIDDYDTNTQSAAVMSNVNGIFCLIFADYEGEKLKNINIVRSEFKEGLNTISQTDKSFTLGKGDKVMLWGNMSALIPVCQTLNIE